MISNKLKYVLVFGFVVFFSSAWEDRWEEMNNDPGRLEELPDEYLFTSAVRGAFRDGLNDMQLNFGAQYAHISIADKFNREIDKYSSTHARGDVYEGLFKSIYNGSIRLTNEVLQLTSEGKFANPVRHAQATTISIVNFAKLTDLYGDIPYSEAGMGKSGILKPKYDRQEDIYADMVAQLKNSLETLKAASAIDAYPADFDPLYSGDLDNWIRFTNSLRFRLAMRARFADPSKYDAIIAETLNEPLIEENNQGATLEHWDSNDGSLYNPWYNKIIDYDKGNLNMLWSEKFINWLKDTNDPRLPLISTKNKNDEYLGMPNGLADIPNSAWSKANTSRPTADFFARDQPLYIMNAAEIWLLRSEAALFGLGSGNANDLFQSGIDRAMSMWGTSSADIQNYLDNETLGALAGTQEEQFEQIGSQMWVAFIPNFVESWHNIRRTGYPVIPQRVGSDMALGVTNGILPKKVRYPFTVEKTVNGENLQEAIDRMGGEDKIDVPVWWDAR